MGFVAHEKTLMLVDVWWIETVAFSDLAEKDRKTYDLIIDWNVNLLFSGIVVIVRQKVELLLLLNCDFL